MQPNTPPTFTPNTPAPLSSNKNENRRPLMLIIVGAVILVLIGILITVLALPKAENQFGKYIRIQNYTDKVKNAPQDTRDATESYLYNIVKKNAADPSKVNDAMIRDGSNTESHDNKTDVTSGNFIVDMASIKQSYYVQYSYAPQQLNTDVGGNPVVISCLPADKLKYGEFNCTDFVSEQAGPHDNLLQYLPYDSYDFSITPDATQGSTLVLHITLTMPGIDQTNDLPTKQAMVATYKQEVTDWLTSKGVNPSDYTLSYNYDDNGNLIIQPTPTGGD